MVDFKTLRDNYLKQWHELEFHPAFETFVAPGSVKGYGVYDKISNTFPLNTKDLKYMLNLWDMILKRL